MLKILAAFLVVTALTTFEAVEAKKDLWLTDYQAAVAKATKENKPLLLNFTGSDWCGWCIKLKKEVFDTKEFKEWAEKKVVLLEVDFPSKKPLEAKTKTQNTELQTRFTVQGFPTIVFLNPTGLNKLGDFGYAEGGPKPWTEKVDAILAAAAK